MILVRADPPTPAKGNITDKCDLPLWVEGIMINSPQHFPIPDLPPYAVRTPHIHGATAYGAPNSSGGLTPAMRMMRKMVTMMPMMMMQMMMIMTGETHRHQPLLYTLGGAESHPPWVSVPTATHILRGQIPKYWTGYRSPDGHT